jgi:hypothetical protein
MTGSTLGRPSEDLIAEPDMATQTHSMSVLHIVFTLSAAVDLRRALATVDRDDEVVAAADDLSFGPINPACGDLRAKWVAEVLGYSSWDSVEQKQEQFWSEALSERAQRVAWVSRRSTIEFCGFLEWLRRNGKRPCKVVDLTDVKFPSNGDAGHYIIAPVTSLIRDYQFSGARLWDLAAPLTSETRVKWMALWDNLRCENAPLRILLSSERLDSAPLDVFDEQILDCIGGDWGKAALAVGRFLHASAYDGFCSAGVHQIGDMVPIARIAALIKAGKIEGRGNPFELQTCSIRRRSNGRP